MFPGPTLPGSLTVVSKVKAFWVGTVRRLEINRNDCCFFVVVFIVVFFQPVHWQKDHIPGFLLVAFQAPATQSVLHHSATLKNKGIKEKKTPDIVMCSCTSSAYLFSGTFIRKRTRS